MSKQLLAYQISGQTIGIDIGTWNDSDLNGNSPYLMILSGQTIPNGYVNISSIVNWDRFGVTIANDYLVVKFEIKDLCVSKGWNNLTNDEKDLAIKYYSYPDFTSAVIYLMTVKGMSQPNAQGFLLLQWHRHHGGVLNSCKQRWYYVKFVVPKFLSFLDSDDLLNSIEPLIATLNNIGRQGINYGDNKDGIMDYVESTNSFTGQGLRQAGYTLLYGDYDIFIAEIKDVLINGIYNKYIDIHLI